MSRPPDSMQRSRPMCSISSWPCARNSRPRSCSSATISRSSPECAIASVCSMPGGWWKKVRRPRFSELRNTPIQPDYCAACRSAGARRMWRRWRRSPVSCRLPVNGGAVVFSPAAAGLPIRNAVTPIRCLPILGSDQSSAITLNAAVRSLWRQRPWSRGNWLPPRVRRSSNSAMSAKPMVRKGIR